MKIDRPATFGLIKSYFGILKQSQVDAFNLFFDEWDGVDKRHLAYILATAWHETAKTMLPIEEYGKGKGKKYEGKYYGRGYVQLTWDYNYKKAGEKLGVDFLKFPEKVMEKENAIKICFLGMSEGWFTGKKLSNYFNSEKSDPVNARRIINGLDKAELICDYYNKFLNSIV
jgi:putative chitinase